MTDVRAMADGKAKRQASIVWQIRVGGIELRCYVRQAQAGLGYVVEAKSVKGLWDQVIANGEDPAELFTKTAATLNVARALRVFGVRGVK